MVKNIIEVKDISKSFEVSSKKPGLKGTLKHFFNRETKKISVIKNLLTMPTQLRDHFSRSMDIVLMNESTN